MGKDAKDELRDIEEQLASQGWRIELRKGGHIGYFPPDGSPPVFGPATPSEYRSLDNVRAKLRRAGAILMSKRPRPKPSGGLGLSL